MNKKHDKKKTPGLKKLVWKNSNKNMNKIPNKKHGKKHEP